MYDRRLQRIEQSATDAQVERVLTALGGGRGGIDYDAPSVTGGFA
jgi:hypothetical protein